MHTVTVKYLYIRGVAKNNGYKGQKSYYKYVWPDKKVIKGTCDPNNLTKKWQIRDYKGYGKDFIDKSREVCKFEKALLCQYLWIVKTQQRLILKQN